MLKRCGRIAWTVVDFLIPRRAADVLLWATVGPAAFACFYWAWVDVQPLVRSESEIVTPVVQQGQELQISYNVDWSRSCQITGYRAVIDSKGVLYNVDPDTRYVHRGDDSFTIEIPIPFSAAPGVALYRATLLYECNPWQRFISPLRREVRERSFTIVPGTPTAGGLSSIDTTRLARLTAPSVP